jgi:nickel transport protein
MVNSRKCLFQRATKMCMVCMAATLGMLLMTMPALAHKVNVFAYVEGDRVVVEGYFGGNVKAQDCPVEVYDQGGKKIHEGKTDKKGIYSFALADLPAFSGGLRIVLGAGMGHRAEYVLSAADIPGSDSKKARPEEQPRESTSEQAPAADPTVATLPVAGSTQVMDQAALTAALESALDKKLAPIVRMLGKQEKMMLEEKYGGPKMTDIIGGIGWILGLAGIASFCWGRTRSAKK